MREKSGKLEMAGACDMLTGASHAHDKPVGTFVVPGMMFDGCWKDAWITARRLERTDVQRDKEMGKSTSILTSSWICENR